MNGIGAEVGGKASSQRARKMMRAADVTARLLEAWGFNIAFGVPGESYLALLDALHDTDGFRFINCRQEGGAAMAAEAHARATGKLGLVMVTRGPGLTNASAGIHVAQQGSTPLIVLIGMPARETERRDAFQELDIQAFGQVIGKEALIIRDPHRIAEQLSHAVHLAISGRPGPVLVGLPEDMLTEEAGDTSDALLSIPVRPRSVPTPDLLAQAADTLANAKRPFVIAGGAGWTPDATRALERFATRYGVPVGAAWRRQDVLDNTHPCYAGHLGLGIDPKLAERIRSADVILVAGARLGEATTDGYKVLVPPAIGPRLIHIHPDPNELGAVYRPSVALEGDPAATLDALAVVACGDVTARDIWRGAARADYEAFTTPIRDIGNLQMAQVVAHVSATVPPQTAIANGAGNYAIWLHRFFLYRRFGQQLGPQSGTMGYGIPAAIGAAFANPEARAVAFAGDGCALMTLQELATIAEHQLPIVVIVVDNGRYGTIRMHQERDFPGRSIGTEVTSPDFASVARGFGLAATTVHTTEEFISAFDAAFKTGAPHLLHLLQDRNVISPGRTL
ncbi:MAG: thiamine pyrophosphate-binding protein [Paracoccaceae bacterium]|jgi:acetolactate synthase I/II/III large subunit|nr:thiamine pyrophosphate-binding protein [Paracoccaceae bacterium]